MKRRKISRIAPLIALAVVITIPLYYPYISEYSPYKINNISQNKKTFEVPIVKPAPNIHQTNNHDGGGEAVVAAGKVGGRKSVYTRARARARPNDEKCDLFTGEWVPNPEAPYYTNETCEWIQHHQNCMKYGRPDVGYLKWRWKPDDCELPIFDPKKFLEFMRGKGLAFVGDSVARNHMQSLMCLLSGADIPVDVSNPVDQNKRYVYKEHNFKISIYFSPFLVKADQLENEPFSLYLDEFDEHWTSKIALYDYVIISAAHWFPRPSYFYINNRLVGCLVCHKPNVTELKSIFSFRRAFRTALRAINNATDFKGVTFLRTISPSHFEGGLWNEGGNCVRTSPVKRKEATLKDNLLEMYLIQQKELSIARRAGRRTGKKFRLLDGTKPMLLRPDGHPSKYGHWPVENVTMPNDCVHWCLPGPIDAWNDILQELLLRENEDNE